MTTTLRFPRDLLRLLYWMYFKPFTLRRYAKSLDERLDERLKLWEVKDVLTEVSELRELVRLYWLLVIVGPITFALLAIIVLVKVGVPLNLTYVLLVIIGYSMGMCGGHLIKWQGIASLRQVRIVSLGLAGAIIVYLVLYFLRPDWRQTLVGDSLSRVLQIVSGTAIGLALGMTSETSGAMNGMSVVTLAIMIVGGLASITRGATSSMASGIAFGVMFGLLNSAPGGVASDILLGMVWVLILGGLERASAAMNAVNGIVGGAVFIAVYFRLFIYAIELPLQMALSWFAERNPQLSTIYFRFSPVQWDELIWLPLVGLSQHLVTIGGQETRDEVQEAIALVAGSFRQGWAAREALVKLAALEMGRATDTQTLAKTTERLTWLPPDLPREVESLLPPMRQIAQRTWAAMESDTLVNKFDQLQRAQAELVDLQQGLTSGSAAGYAEYFAHPLASWQYILNSEVETLRASINALPIPPVYVVGAPLIIESKVFKGRRDLFVMLERELTGIVESRPSLLLYGARRSGKTSVLRQLPVRLGPDYVPVEIDLQSAATASGPAGLMGYIAGRIVDNALTHRRLRLPALKPATLETDPYLAFLNWLGEVGKTLSGKKILLNLDEYERLEEMVRDGRLDRRVFNWLRGMIQHHPSVVVLLSGSHEPFELEPVWSDTLINVRTLRVGPLEEKEARELITTPVPDFPLKYEAEAIERILTASGRQPYLIQATCRDLVDKLNEEQSLNAGVADIERAFESCLQTAQAYFVELWKSADTDDTQRKIMIALAQGGEMLSEVELAHKVGEASLTQILRRLERRDIIEKTDGGYRFRADLVRRWVLQNSGR